MLPKERVIAALEHREPDRIPWGEHWIDYNVYEDILGRPTLMHAKMRETQAQWDGRRDEIIADYERDTLDLVRALEMDIVTVESVPPAGHRPKAMEKLDEETYRDEGGTVWRVSATTHNLMPYQWNTDNYVPPTFESLEKQLEDLENAPLWDVNDSAWEVVRHAVAEMGDTHFIAILAGDLSFPTFGATEEEGWMNLLLEPDLCRKIAEVTGKTIVHQLKSYAAMGVDGIIPCGDLGSSTSLLASPEIYRDMVYPWHKAHAEEATRLGLKTLKHCCGHVWPIIDELCVYDAYEGIQGTAGMDVGELKERVAGRLALWGGIWHEHIILGDVEDIRNDARHAFSEAAPGGGFIMGSSHSLAVDAKAANVLEMKRCRDEWGTYPIDPIRFAP